MSALLIPAVFLAVLGGYSLIEDIIWATRPMARRLSKRELRKLYRKGLS
jgi:hypothetical protein